MGTLVGYRGPLKHYQGRTFSVIRNLSPRVEVTDLKGLSYIFSEADLQELRRCVQCGDDCSAKTWGDSHRCFVHDKGGGQPIRRCWKCDREWSATLDAYYGRDPAGKLYCAPCRGRAIK